MKLYEKHGFVATETIELGMAKADKDRELKEDGKLKENGELKEDGEGLKS